MIPNVYTLLIVIAFALTILAGMGKAPLWVAVLLVTVALLVQVLGR